MLSAPQPGPGGPLVCLALSRTASLFLTVNSPSALAHLWRSDRLSSPPTLLKGHQHKVTVGDICRETEEQLITCSKDRIILWTVGGEGLTVARDMGEMSSCRLVVETEKRRGWIVVGVGPDLWLLRLNYTKQRRAGGEMVVRSVEKHVVIETQHTGSISDIWLQPSSQTLMSAAEDCKVKIWSFKVREESLKYCYCCDAGRTYRDCGGQSLSRKLHQCQQRQPHRHRGLWRQPEGLPEEGQQQQPPRHCHNY